MSLLSFLPLIWAAGMTGYVVGMVDQCRLKRTLLLWPIYAAIIFGLFIAESFRKRP